MTQTEPVDVFRGYRVRREVWRLADRPIDLTWPEDEATELLDFVEQPAARRYERVLAADMLYERRLAEPLAAWIASALTPGGYALVSDPNRAAADGFGDCLARHGLRAQFVSVETTAPAGLPTRGRIWRVTRSGSISSKSAS
ncbi:MAG: hypothetical protein HY718_12885 [Planctomycetes bacterium]|nr:hypothetical protein [Planctomycetota bacterium]